MATRTAPAVTGSANIMYVSFHFIDASGDKRSCSLMTDLAITDVQIEAVAVAVQAATNASLWKVEQTFAWAGLARVGNATNTARPSVYSNVVLLYKNATQQSQNAFIPAPLETLFIAGSDNVDKTDALFTAFASATQTALGDTYESISTRYSEHREINQSTPL